MMYVRARGLRRRGARLLLAMTVQPVLLSTRRKVSALQIISLSTLDTLPIRTATDASPMPSRTPTHGSRWIVERLLLLSRGLSPPIICQLAWRSRRAEYHRGVYGSGRWKPTARDSATKTLRRRWW